jgi:thioredoxin-like negative regulator of GroEL
MVGGLCTVTWLWAGAPAGRTAWYPDAADAAFEDGDFRTAAVCYSRLNQLHPTDVGIAFSLARSLDAIGQTAAARTLLLRMAPLNGSEGYAPAHLRLARMDLSSDHPTTAAMDDAERHLAPILKAAPADPAGNYWLAVLWAARGKWDQVAAPAAAAASLRDDLAPRLAKIAAAQGNTQKADEWSRPTAVGG